MKRPPGHADPATRLTAFLGRRRAWVLAGTLVIMALAAAGMGRLEIESGFAAFMPAESPQSQALETMSATFGDREPLLVLVELGAAKPNGDGPLEDTEVALLRDLTTRFADVPGVADVLAPAVPRTGAVGPPVVALPGLPGILSDAEGSRHALIQLLPSEPADPQELMAGVREALGATGVSAIVTGEPRLAAEAFDDVQDIVFRLPSLALLLVLLVFRWRIRSMRATLLSLAPAVVAAVLTLGALGWTIGTISIVTALVPLFVLVLGSAAGLHVTSHVLDSLRAGAAARDAVTETLSAVGAPTAFTTVTTMVGFLSLTVIDSPAIRQLGFSAAGGVFLAGVASFLVLPALLLTVPLQAPARGGPRDALPVALARLRGTPVLLLAAALLIAFTPGALGLRADFSMIDLYKPTTDVRRDLERATAILGGSLPQYLTYPDADALDAATAAAVLEVQDRARSEGIADRSVSLPSLLRDVVQAQTGVRAYPQDPVLARAIVAAASASEPGTLAQFVASDGSGRAMLFLTNLEASTLNRLEGLVHEVSSRTGIPLEAIGVAYVIKRMNDRIVPQQLASLALAMALVFLLMLLGQRSLRLAVVTIVPIALTLVVLFGTMRYLGIDLSVATGIMTGLTVGVGVDYAIHFSATLRRERARGAPDAVGAALGFVAQPVLANALGLAIGISVLALSPLQVYVELAILMWVTMVTSAFLSLTLLPTIAGSRFARAASNGPG